MTSLSTPSEENEAILTMLEEWIPSASSTKPPLVPHQGSEGGVSEEETLPLVNHFTMLVQRLRAMYKTATEAAQRSYEGAAPSASSVAVSTMLAASTADQQRRVRKSRASMAAAEVDMAYEREREFRKRKARGDDALFIDSTSEEEGDFSAEEEEEIENEKKKGWFKAEILTTKRYEWTHVRQCFSIAVLLSIASCPLYASPHS